MEVINVLIFMACVIVAGSLLFARFLHTQRDNILDKKRYFLFKPLLKKSNRLGTMQELEDFGRVIEDTTEYQNDKE